MQLDLALGEARAGHTDEAQRLVDTLQPALLPPHGQAFIDWVRGMIALRDPARAGEAASHLGKACEQFLGLVRKAPGAWPSLAVCTCDYALALAWSGRAEMGAPCLPACSQWPGTTPSPSGWGCWSASYASGAERCGPHPKGLLHTAGRAPWRAGSEAESF